MTYLNKDDNVDVIYVSPIELTEETLQYYAKLFGLRRAVLSSDPSEHGDVTSRYKVVHFFEYCWVWCPATLHVQEVKIGS